MEKRSQSWITLAKLSGSAHAQVSQMKHSSHTVSSPFYHVLSPIIRYKRLLIEILYKSILDYVCNGIKMNRSW